ncbi:hypothetical protein FSB08_33635 [Paraburkholderia sp. JPY432]|uniref:hypothetical protein n=1 Tax=Paraburkholderia youngii TaxID=2782701 RepID=UPI001595AEC3|nr:hypothetical protein [Paraburkholderia youngii]NVH77306.1 hypothetical protein [Paraburkholderia youngii]
MIAAMSFIAGLLAVFIVCDVHYETPQIYKGRVNRVLANLAVFGVGCSFGLICARFFSSPARHVRVRHVLRSFR